MNLSALLTSAGITVFYIKKTTKQRKRALWAKVFQPLNYSKMAPETILSRWRIYVDVPYSFPEFVTPVGKRMSKKEKIRLNVNAGPGTEVLCRTISHPLKFSPDGSLFVAGFQESHIRIYNVDGGWKVQKDIRARKLAALVDDTCISNPLEGSILGIEVEAWVYVYNFHRYSNLSITVRWPQKPSYQDGEFTLMVPYSFPEFVTPVGKRMSKKEKIRINVNAGPGTEVLCKTISHPLKELRHHGEKLSFLYYTEVLTWSSCDFVLLMVDKVQGKP
ncbi:hypothetical protein POM88_019324 [Heracleum sosnowskyi]|uniref:Uncharacterized protein n=1 Tax=Heracleum sosnowskyi TaxID=360622 RepID=A0AAD8IT06_9APIA|nr:hypothetical protein POM88_019324 [Heracleum sosnowskyi]